MACWKLRRRKLFFLTKTPTYYRFTTVLVFFFLNGRTLFSAWLDSTGVWDWWGR
ncbi:hypothetical protein BU23DRAFT_89957 [Bimuria novae-zelandiae CBS 107.79]|uniref:Uncharacterized protein n=1 Tax=Bimuria novae-zelandiae CBS 107.79 TaxID=1447943 RepID=A0A6A5VFQ1_9PLEO|nr:hypothetical protein BU23DRAFT_89957 [Bimuria novae-zelandiae CBS 107.79]